MSKKVPTNASVQAKKVLARLLPGADGKHYEDRARRDQEKRWAAGKD